MNVVSQLLEFLVVGMDNAIENGNHILGNMDFSPFDSGAKRVGHIIHIAKPLSTFKTCGIDSDVSSERIR